MWKVEVESLPVEVQRGMASSRRAVCLRLDTEDCIEEGLGEWWTLDSC